MAIVVGAGVLGLLIVCGNMHIVTGNGVGHRFAARDSFGFSEMFINVDTITGTPIIAAAMKYPIGVRILQRNGYIETFDEMQDRAMEEAMESMGDAMEAYERVMQEAMQDAQAAQDQAMRDYRDAMRELERSGN